MAKIGKRLKNILASVDLEKIYSAEEALKIIKENAKAKFDETVEISLQLGVDPKHSDQAVRGAIAMPNGLGKKIRVAVFARDDKAEAAKAAGADIVGAEDLMEQIQKGEINFDRCIASPDMMGIVGRVGKLLGPRGLMPNPKLGTVTPNVADAVKLAKSGQVEFRVEKAGIIHAGIGKASFDVSALLANLKVLIDAIKKARPTSIKGTYLQKMSISSTMGVGVNVEIASVS